MPSLLTLLLPESWCLYFSVIRLTRKSDHSSLPQSFSIPSTYLSHGTICVLTSKPSFWKPAGLGISCFSVIYLIFKEWTKWWKDFQNCSSFVCNRQLTAGHHLSFPLLRLWGSKGQPECLFLELEKIADLTCPLWAPDKPTSTEKLHFLFNVSLSLGWATNKEPIQRTKWQHLRFPRRSCSIAYDIPGMWGNNSSR